MKKFIISTILIIAILAVTGCQKKEEVVVEEPLIPAVPVIKGPDGPPQVKGPSAPPPARMPEAVTETEEIEYTLPEIELEVVN